MTVCMLVFVLGPLGFPALWRGSAFSVKGKLLLTVFVSIEISLLVWLCVHFFQRAYNAWQNFL